MHEYQWEFIRFALDRNVLRFGEFTLKSGRTSPYFFNAGLFNTGGSLARLGRYYAQALIHNGPKDIDMIFGPAYKGIPLAAATSISLADSFDIDLPYCFNRKEAKDHDEGGSLVGAPLQGKVAIVDDVRSEEHTSELQSRPHLVCRLLLEKKKKHTRCTTSIPSSTAEWISMAATASAVPRR